MTFNSNFTNWKMFQTLNCRKETDICLQAVDSSSDGSDFSIDGEKIMEMTQLWLALDCSYINFSHNLEFFSLAWVKYQLSWYKKMLLIFLRWPVITISDTVLSKIYWLFILCPCNSHTYNRQSNKVLCSKIASTNAIVKVFNYFKISIPREVLKIQCSKCRWKDTF